MHMSPDLDDLFLRNVDAKNLDKENMPTAVRFAINAMSQAVISPFADLLEELPSEARAFEWMAALYAAYAEFCDHTVIVNEGQPTPATPESQAAEPPAGE